MAKRKVSKAEPFKDWGWLSYQYYGLRKSYPQIASELGVPDHMIRYYMDKFGFKRRPQSEAISMSMTPTRRAEISACNRRRRHSEATRAKMSIMKKGPLHPQWRGGRNRTRAGYVFVHAPAHLNANTQGYVMEHRLVMEEAIGRSLRFEECVHHINGDPGDNRPENLRLFKNSGEHLAFHNSQRAQCIRESRREK